MTFRVSKDKVFTARTLRSNSWGITDLRMCQDCLVAYAIWVLPGWARRMPAGYHPLCLPSVQGNLGWQYDTSTALTLTTHIKTHRKVLCRFVPSPQNTCRQHLSKWKKRKINLEEAMLKKTSINLWKEATERFLTILPRKWSSVITVLGC